MTVEGFSNYATFGVAVTLDNDPDAVEDTANRARMAPMLARTDETVKAGTWTVEECIRFRYADWLKAYCERRCEQGTRTGNNVPALLAAQMVQAGLAEVDWAELAAHYLGDES